MKVIFLDIDGVLNSTNFVEHKKQVKGFGKIMVDSDKLDPDCISRLNNITDATGAKIVISSTWRYGFLHDMSKLISLLKISGITGDIIGVTPTTENSRENEIMQWLSVQPDVDSYVTIDDDQLDFGPRAVTTDIHVGLTPADANSAIRILNNQKS